MATIGKITDNISEQMVNITWDDTTSKKKEATHWSCVGVPKSRGQACKRKRKHFNNY